MNMSFEETDFQSVWQVLVRRKWVLVGSLVAGLALAVGMNVLSRPVYRATTRIEIGRQPSRSPLTGEVVESPSAQSENLALFTTEQLITNRPLLHQLADKLHDSGVFDDAAGAPGLLRGLGARIAFLHATTTTPPADDQAHVDWLLRAISVRPVRDTRLVDIQVEHARPASAKTIAETLAKLFVEYETGERVVTASGQVESITRQLADLRVELAAADRRLAGRPLDAGAGVDVDARAHASALGDLSSERFKAATELRAADARLRAMTAFRVDGTADWSNLPIQDHRLQDLSQSLAQKRHELDAARAVYGPQHPRLMALETEERSIRENLVDTWNSALQTAKSDREALAGREAELRRGLGEERGAVRQANDGSRRFATLEAEVATKRELFNVLLKKLQESQVVGAMPDPLVRIVEPASVGEAPVKPRKLLNVAVGLGVGLIFGAGLALSVEYFRRTLRTPGDVVRELELPVLGMIPRES